MTKPYRIRHKASGLYYQPAINHSNLSKKGKVYMTNNSLLMLNNSYDYIAISVRKGTKVHDILEKEMPLKGVESFYGKAVCYRVPKSEFEKEELQSMKPENIKFKAKRLDDNSWVFGYFYEENGNTYIIENRQKESKLNRNITYQVDPSTVCQFTGLTDCEGNEVWEGDIIGNHDFPFEKRTVTWANCLSCFIPIDEDGGQDRHLSLLVLFKKWTVVGNKFDKEKQRMKKISFNLKYLITKYDWCFYFIPSLIVWKPYSGVYEINVAFLLWEFNIKYQLKRKKI